MKKSILLILAAILVGVTGTMGGQGERTAVRDADLGLSKTSVFEVPSPPAVKDDETDPGDGPLRPRAFEEAPPAIPHGIADLLPLTMKENACLDCHTGGDAKQVPASHRTDLRHSPDKTGKDVVGARYVCITCHVPQTDAKPLVGNSF